MIQIVWNMKNTDTPRCYVGGYQHGESSLFELCQSLVTLLLRLVTVNASSRVSLRLQFQNGVDKKRIGTEADTEFKQWKK